MGSKQGMVTWSFVMELIIVDVYVNIRVCSNVVKKKMHIYPATFSRNK